MLNERTGTHFQGLQQASRVLRKTSHLPDRLAKKITNVDVAFNLIWHITVASLDSFVKELDAALPSLANGAQQPMVDPSYPARMSGATPVTTAPACCEPLPAQDSPLTDPPASTSSARSSTPSA